MWTSTGGWTPLAPSTCVHQSLTLLPLRGDVINGWPLMLLVRHVGRHRFLSYLTLGPHPVGVGLGHSPGHYPPDIPPRHYTPGHYPPRTLPPRTLPPWILPPCH